MNIRDYRRARVDSEPEDQSCAVLSEADKDKEEMLPSGRRLGPLFSRSPKQAGRHRRPVFLDAEMIMLIILVGGAFIALSVMALTAR